MKPVAPTPIEPLALPAFAKCSLDIHVKRDDLIHPRILGNKLRKSLPQLELCRAAGHGVVISFGGRYSNHLLALAQIGQELGIPVAGIVRGTDRRGHSPVLDECARLGMRILTVDANDYYPLQKLDSVQLARRLGLDTPPCVIPEGGTSASALDGVAQIIAEIPDLPAYDYIVCASGTGGTTAGLVWGLARRTETKLPKVLALSVLKGYTGLPEPGLTALRDQAGAGVADDFIARHLRFDGSAPWGRYGKPSASVMARLRALQDAVPFPLDYVYTGKAMLQLELMAQAGRFPRGSRLLFLHTGGYQTAPIT